MRDEWQEIDRLRSKIRRLRNILTRQTVIAATHPAVKVGDIVEVDNSQVARFTVQERTINSLQQQQYKEIQPIGSDPGGQGVRQPVAFLLDDDGIRFLWPESGRIILVQDQGGGQGKHVEKNALNQVSTPPNSEILDLVVVEPVSRFHDGKFPVASGRIYRGMKLVDEEGAGYYCVFIRGFGPFHKTEEIDFETSSLFVNLQIDRDSAGKILAVRGSAQGSFEFDPDYLLLGSGSLAGPSLNSVYAWTNRYTIGDATNYFCATPLWADDGHISSSNKPHSPYRDFVSAGPVFEYKKNLWNVTWYENYDLNDTFTNPVQSNGFTEFGGFNSSNPNLSNFIFIKMAGTGIPNKDSFFPMQDVYKQPDFDDRLFIQVEEKAYNTKGNTTDILPTSKRIRTFYDPDLIQGFPYQNQVGKTLETTSPTKTDTINQLTIGSTRVLIRTVNLLVPPLYTPSTVWEIIESNRKSKMRTNGTNTQKANTHPHWNLLAVEIHDKYDPVTDTPGSGDYLAVDCGVKDSDPGFGAHQGWNDEANKFLIAIQFTLAPNVQIEGWSDITAKGNFYALAYTFKATRNAKGGRVYTSRLASNWRKWNAFLGVWEPAVPESILGGSTAVVLVGDEWKSERFGGVGNNFTSIDLI